MISLQRTIKYAGEAKANQSVDLVFQINGFSYAIDSNGTLSRTAGPTDYSASVTYALADDRYRIVLDDECLANGDTASLALASRYYQQALDDGNLDALTVSVAASYRLSDGQLVGQSIFDMLVITKIPLSVDRTQVLSRVNAGPGSRPAFWVINKSRYMALRKALAGTSVAANDAWLLGALSNVVQAPISTSS